MNIGDKFNKWTVIGEVYKNGYVPFAPCKCECGTERAVNTYDLKTGKSKNCGCVRKITTRNRSYRHGFSNSRLESVLNGMKIRCYDTKNPNYKNYGARGIKICEEWLQHTEKFYSWAIENGYKQGLTIDRINVDGNYEPSNCKWSTRMEQARNKRTNIFLTIDGETKCLKDWCRKFNIHYGTATKRVRKGMDPLEALKRGMIS